MARCQLKSYVVQCVTVRRHCHSLSLKPANLLTYVVDREPDRQNHNKCVSTLAGRKAHLTALRYAARNSECPPSYGAQFRLPRCDFYIAHARSNAAAVTPREPKFGEKRREAHHG